MTALKYIAVFLPLRGRWGGHIAVNFLAAVVGEDFAVLKVCRGTSEYKIYITAYKAVLVILPSVDSWSELLRTDEAARLKLLRWERTCKYGVLTA